MPREDLPFCECDWLERAARDSACAIEFDPKLNEYNLTTTDGGYKRIYHCPFCAGRAPESLRALIFATVPHEEIARLHQLTKELKTEEQVLKQLGEPTHVFDPGETRIVPDKDGKPGEIRTWKTLRYEGHSDTGMIEVCVSHHGKVRFSFRGKYVGLPDAS